MAYLFDTDAISEVFKRRPAASYIAWLETVPRSDQFASAVSIGELYRGAFRVQGTSRHLDNIDERVLPALSVLPFDAAVARTYGRISAELESIGKPLTDAGLQIAATALHHDLALVTGNVQHFERVPGLRIEPKLAESR